MKTNNTTDWEIIQNIRKGYIADYRLLVDKYKDVSYTLACTIVKDQHLAEDVLQDAFLKVFNALRKFKGTSAFSTWLYRIVVNTSYDAVNRQKKFPVEGWEHQVEDYELDSYQTAETSDRQQYINRALHAMKPDEALLLRLYYLSELSVNEIKEVTSFSESKIKVTLLRARKNLQGILEKQLGTEINQLL